MNGDIRANGMALDSLSGPQDPGCGAFLIQPEGSFCRAAVEMAEQITSLQTE